MAAATKRKKVSKKSKQSWRKHTDIKDVGEYLEGARREERTGGPVSEKPNEGLFFVDKKPKAVGGQPKERSRKRKLLKVDELLIPESKIKPVGSKQRKIKGRLHGSEKNQSDSSDPEIEERNSAPVSEMKETKRETRTMFDLWGREDSPAGDEHFLKTTRRKKVKKPNTVNRKTSTVQAIEVCSSGASYNPAYDDHQSLLETAHVVEAQKLKEIEKLDRKVKYLTHEEAANLPTWTEEMSQGLFVNDDKEEDEAESDGDNEGVSVRSVRAEDRKTKQQKRKEKEQFEEQMRLETEKKEKLREQEIFRLKTLRKEINLSEQKAKEKRKKKENNRQISASKPKRLSKYQYKSPDIEIKLSGEITGNLRSLKQEGNLFEDRFKSLQRRNLIETRQRVKPHRKYKKKEYTRKSYNSPCITEIRF